jgi:dihydrofolate reductase
VSLEDVALTIDEAAEGLLVPPASSLDQGPLLGFVLFETGAHLTNLDEALAPDSSPLGSGIRTSVSGAASRRLIYSMTVSLDGFIAGPEGEIDWGAPDEELHRFHNDRMRELGGHLLGRRLYEVMTFWETADQNPAARDYELEFARIWKDLPKIVFSATLESVEGNARLVREDAAEVVAGMKDQPGKDLAVGGAGLASSLIDLDLIDEYRLFVSPVILGGGTPYLPTRAQRLDLELLETRTFGSRVAYLRYGRAERGR